MKNLEDDTPKKDKKISKQPAIPAETYPAGMEAQRGEPEGGEEKPGLKNPEPLPSEK